MKSTPLIYLAFVSFSSAFLTPSSRTRWSSPHPSTTDAGGGGGPVLVFASTPALDVKLTETTESTIDINQFLGPPPPLDRLAVGESYKPLESAPVLITKLSDGPPIFLLKDFLCFQDDRKTLMESSMQSMEYAKTTAGVVQHRVKSSVAWKGNDETSDDIGDHIADFMAQFSASLFIDKTLIDGDYVEAERLQIVKYEKGGKFDVHHDGYNRTVTVISYLNGVASTWFPYLGCGNDEIPTMKLESKGMLDNKIPGRDGLWIVGRENPAVVDSSKVARVQPGDAVVFYNYEYNHDVEKRIMAWKSLHAGLPTNQEKWIATTWLSLKEEN